jgi:glucose-1-phosphate thymidylyltransferase
LINNQITAIIPAAGHATRLGRLPFSKELYPIGFENYNKKINPKVVSSYLLDNMAIAGVTSFHFIIRNGKWDIPAFFESGKKFGYNICYHIADNEYGVPFTVNQAFPFYKDKIIVFGFPDNLFVPENAYSKLINELKQKDISIALGLFPTSSPEKYDLVDYNESLEITEIKIKSFTANNLKFAWIIAAWKPEFSVFLNSFVTNKYTIKSDLELKNKEYYMGDVIISAINNGMKVQGVLFDQGKFIDIGTPEDLSLSSSFFN